MMDQALSLNQNLAIGWRLRGWAYIYLGQHETALEQVARALRLSPLDPESFHSETAMALAHLFQGRYDEASNWASSALTHQPWMPTMRASAAANALAGHIEEARSMMNRMRQLEPAMSISLLKVLLPYRHRDTERLIEGLRLAGLPE
jgi:tetratricopeptide (TPR) repeat protein